MKSNRHRNPEPVASQGRIGRGASFTDLAAKFAPRSGKREVAAVRNPDHDDLMGDMAQAFDLDPQTIKPRYWGALRDAERLCAACADTRRCRRWLAGDKSAEAPADFCPNAPLFEEIAQQDQKQPESANQTEAPKGRQCAARGKASPDE